jgi:outer membrane protein assembly factor BamD (BamD/ComL family)
MRSATRAPRSPAAPRAEANVQPSEPAPESRAASRLREESAAVLAIRKTLLSGDPREALRMLDRAASEFPNGALAQEREALSIRALVDSGEKEAARRRGEAFLRAYPKSPHAAEVRALVGG